MAGFEIVVRPVILPNIRPAPAQTLPPVDDPTKGICEIKGTSPHIVTLSHSMSISGSEQRSKETQRRSDTAQISDNKDTKFVEVRVANKIWMDPGRGSGPTQMYFKRAEESPNVTITKRDEIIKA